MNNENTPTIRIVAIVGSVRPGCHTKMAIDLVVDELQGKPGVVVDIIDPIELDLVLPGQEETSDDGEKIRELVTGAAGVIISTPEYHGSYSSTVKMVIDNLGYPSMLSGKPIALLGVAAGSIGAVKALEHLRSVCSHVGGLVLPGPVSVASVHKVFDGEGNCLDPAIEKRIRGAGTKLVDYIHNHICPKMAMEEVARGGSTEQ